MDIRGGFLLCSIFLNLSGRLMHFFSQNFLDMKLFSLAPQPFNWNERLFGITQRNDDFQWIFTWKWSDFINGFKWRSDWCSAFSEFIRRSYYIYPHQLKFSFLIIPFLFSNHFWTRDWICAIYNPVKNGYKNLARLQSIESNDGTVDGSAKS